MSGRPKAALVLAETEREELTALTWHRKTAQRARIVLACASGLDNQIVAARQRVAKHMVSKWGAKCVAHRLRRLAGRATLSRPENDRRSRVDAVIAKTLKACQPTQCTGARAAWPLRPG